MKYRNSDFLNDLYYKRQEFSELISKAKNWSLLSVNSIKNIGTIILAIVLIHNMAITGALGLSISRVAFSCMVVPALVYCYNNKNIRK